MPLPPYLFPLTLQRPLRELRTRVDNLEGGGMVVAYHMCWSNPSNGKVIRWAEELLAGVGLKLNVSKTYFLMRPDRPNTWADWARSGAKRDVDIKILRQSLPTLLTDRVRLQ